MANEWQELTDISKGAAMNVERVRIPELGVTIEGSFELPPLAALTMDDQIFIIAFIRSHGSIKEMEATFGISYPTVKNRLNRITSRLQFVEINPPGSRTEILDQLENGEISVDEAVKNLRGL